MNRSPEVERFYTSWIWRKCRQSFIQAKGGLCERCLARGKIEAGSADRPLEVHHKIALNWDNLELLCKRCHDAEKERKSHRWTVDESGHVEPA